MLDIYRVKRVQESNGGLMHYRTHEHKGPEGFAYALQDSRITGDVYVNMGIMDEHWIQHYDKSWSRYRNR